MNGGERKRWTILHIRTAQHSTVALYPDESGGNLASSKHLLTHAFSGTSSSLTPKKSASSAARATPSSFKANNVPQRREWYAPPTSYPPTFRSLRLISIVLLGPLLRLLRMPARLVHAGQGEQVEFLPHEESPAAAGAHGNEDQDGYHEHGRHGDLERGILGDADG